MKGLRVLRSSRIFSNGGHNAFTSIASRGEELFIAFRSGTAHLASDGKIRVLKSSDKGKSWSPYAEITLSGWDLRDPGMIFFADKLHLFCFGRKAGHESEFLSFHCELRSDGRFSALETLKNMPVIWGIAAHGGKLYGTAYHSAGKNHSRVPQAEPLPQPGQHLPESLP